MYLVCTDLEGIFVPEIWINVAEKTGVADLRLTTRDIPDYDVLMQKRLSILKAHGITLADIQEVIGKMEPLEGAAEFLDWLRSVMQVIVVSDTYTEFTGPLMKKLGWPTLFCHNLTVDAGGMIQSYNLRQKDGKRRVVEAMKGLNYQVLAIGDSYNDIKMLEAADHGILFRPPENVEREYPQFRKTTTYADLKTVINRFLPARS